MKSYSQVYNNSKAQVLEQRNALIESQKTAVVNVLKENYMITGKMKDLSPEKKAEMLKKLLEYWNPKTGINAAGIKLLNENMITLTPNSTSADIRLYIQKQTKKNLLQITECFRMNRRDAVVESFNDEIKPMIGKKVKEKVIIDTVWEIIAPRIKAGL